MKKNCNRCKRYLDFSVFKPSNRTNDGLQSCCKECAEKVRLAAKDRYEKDTAYRERVKKNKREKYHSDPKFKEKINKQRAVNQLKQYHSDPKFKEKLNKQTAKNFLIRYHNDPKTRVHTNISSQIRHSLKNGKKGQHWETLVGFTVDELMKHLEALFEEGMTWDNYGKWYIDHRTPKSWFNFETTGDLEFKKCWDLENLKPMWGGENIAKGNRFSD